MSAKYADNLIEAAIDGNRWTTVTAMTQYRQMLAMEAIAESLAELEQFLRQPPVMLTADEAANIESMKPGTVEYVGPALQHSRRKRFPAQGT